MQCLHPILVPNQSKFLITSNRDRLLMYVRCGKCANCQKNKHAEYEFRAYKQFEDCVNKGGFVLFDTLTYRDADLPTLRKYEEFQLLPSYRDYMCFNSRHVTLFHKRLRKKLHSLGFDDAYSYFLSSEYGLDDRYTHRPHLHVLFYVRCKIDPMLFSQCVADAWTYGRTDGLPYKPVAYVRNNVFRSLSVGSRRVCKYVSKYVMKDNAFERQIRKRIDFVLYRLADGNVDRLQTDEFKRKRVALRRLCGTFHRQSLGFGISALNGVDPEEVVLRGYFLMPNSKPTMFNKIPICNYYLRKMCYEVVTFEDGLKGWSIRPEFVDLFKRRKERMTIVAADNLRNRFQSVSMTPDVDIDLLADYMVNYRGRNIAPDDEIMTLDDRMCRANRYCYASVSDKNHFNMRFVSSEYLGYKDNYIHPWGTNVPLVAYLVEHSYNQNTCSEFNGYDDILLRLQDEEEKQSASKQNAYDARMRIQKLAKQCI